MYIPIDEHIELNRETHSVRNDGQEVKLTPLEYRLLDYLTHHADRICSRTELLDHVWGHAFRYDTGTIDVHLNALRRKLSFATDSPIETVRGVGLIYRRQTSKRTYTLDLQTFVRNWLQHHQAEIAIHGLTTSIHLTPYVNEITIEPHCLQKLLDSVLAALLPSTQSGTLRIHSKLTLQHFVFTLDLNGTISELRIPINRDF